MSRLCQIKASAGSGKTYTLTWRYLRLLARCLKGEGDSPRLRGACARESAPASFDDILAITFTNAAVTEIRERVIGLLKKAALGIESARGLDKDTARACLDALLCDMSQLNVRTIDSLLHQIVRSSALGLRLYPDFEPVFSTVDAIQPYMDNFMRAALSGDKEYEQILIEAVKGQLEYEEAVHGVDKAKTLLAGKAILRRMEPFLLDVLGPGGDRLASPEDARDMYDKEGKSAAVLAQRLLGELEDVKARNNKIRLDLKTEPARALQALASGKNETGKALLSDGLRGIIKNGEKKTVDLSAAENTYHELRDRILMRMALRDYLKNAPVIRLATKLAEDFYAGLPGGNKIPSGLIPVLAQRALDINEGVCDALCRLGARLSHFMIDEFQDTSLPQWLGLYPLIEDALSRGGSLSWVGDVKQSIFMWRDACPELFDNILNDKNLCAMVERPQKKRLPRNRRSSRPVVDFNNSLFGRLNETDYAKCILAHMLGDKPECVAQAVEKVTSAFEGSIQTLPGKASPAGIVRLEPIAVGGNGADASFIAQFEQEFLNYLRIRKAKKLPFSDVMVLVRKNRDAIPLAAALTENNFPVVTENSLLLAGNPLIEETVAFLGFLDNPEDEIAFLTMIQGKIFSAHPDAQAAVNDGMENLGLRKGKKNLGKYFREQYPLAWENILQPFHEQAKLLTAYDAVKEWYRRLRVEERFPQNRLFLRSFLELLHNAETHEKTAVPEFLEYWREKGDELMAHMPEGLDAVRIMTIHKSKGLQSPVVFVPLTLGAQSVASNQYGTQINREFGGTWLNVPLRKEYKPEYDRKLVQQSVEILDMLYVSFTRAEKELYVYTPKKGGKPPLLQVLAEKAGLPFPYYKAVTEENIPARPEPDNVETAAQPMQHTLGGDVGFVSGGEAQPWLSRLKIARNKLFSRAEKAERRGTFLHSCLENMRFTGQPEEDARRALDFAISHRDMAIDNPEMVLDNLVWFASQPHTGEWLKNGWPEQPLLDEAGREMRIDLLVRQPWGTLVLDYKSGDISPENMEQMQNYLRCLKKSRNFEGMASGLLIYLDKKKFIAVTPDKVYEPSATIPDFPLEVRE